MTDRDEELARLYRALAKEEPPEALDAAILAASRRAVARPSLVRRWAAPVSVAAVLVLAIGLALEMRDQAPGIESPTASPPPANDHRAEPSQHAAPEAMPGPREEKRAAPEAMPAPRQEKRAATEARPRFVPEPPRRAVAPKPATRAMAAPPSEAAPAANVAPAQAPASESRVAPASAPRSESKAAPAPPPESNVAPAPAMARPSLSPGSRSTEKRLSAPAAASSGSAAADLSTQAARPLDDPVASLEAIAKLRAAGRDAQADRALEDFRRRFPDYRIDDATWERVKPR
jgi:hypothetical protein